MENEFKCHFNLPIPCKEITPKRGPRCFSWKFKQEPINANEIFICFIMLYRNLFIIISKFAAEQKHWAIEQFTSINKENFHAAA